MINDVLAEAKEGMEKSIESLQHDLASMRTGRASAGLVDKIVVDYYGTSTSLKEIASVSVPEAQLIAIRPYDPSSLKAIERAILQSDLGLTPNNDGKIIRLQIPTLTEERRRELSKSVAYIAEHEAISDRNLIGESLEPFKNLTFECEPYPDDDIPF